MSERRSRPKGAYEGSEDNFQKEAIKLVRMVAATHGVDACAVMHIPNGGKRSIMTAARLKAQGTVAGYPDIMVFSPQGSQNGLALELKVWPNKPTPDQLAIHKLLKDAGWLVYVCYSSDEVSDVTNDYFGRS